MLPTFFLACLWYSFATNMVFAEKTSLGRSLEFRGSGILILERADVWVFLFRHVHALRFAHGRLLKCSARKKKKEKQITNDYYSSQLCRKTIRNDINQNHLKGNERMTSSSWEDNTQRNVDSISFMSIYLRWIQPGISSHLSWSSPRGFKALSFATAS